MQLTIVAKFSILDACWLPGQAFDAYCFRQCLFTYRCLNFIFGVQCEKQNKEAVARRFSIKNGFFKNYAKFAEKRFCLSLFVNNVAGLKALNVIKKGLQHRYFPVSFVKLLRIPILQNIFKRLLLKTCERIKCSQNRQSIPAVE